MSLSQFVNVPCAKCAKDTLHIKNVCHLCGEPLPLSPRDIRDFDPGVSHEKRTAQRKARALARRAFAKARAVKAAIHPPSMNPMAVRMREYRAAMKARGEKRCG